MKREKSELNVHCTQREFSRWNVNQRQPHVQQWYGTKCFVSVITTVFVGLVVILILTEKSRGSRKGSRRGSRRESRRGSRKGVHVLSTPIWNKSRAKQQISYRKERHKKTCILEINKLLCISRKLSSILRRQ